MDAKKFRPKKVEKTTPKSSILKQKFRRFRNFSLTAQQPKWQNSCSKMWSIEQLYIELGVFYLVKVELSFLNVWSVKSSSWVSLIICFCLCCLGNETKQRQKRKTSDPMNYYFIFQNMISWKPMIDYVLDRAKVQFLPPNQLRLANSVR